MSAPSSERTEGGKGEVEEKEEQPLSTFGETGGGNALSFATGGGDEPLFQMDRSHEMEAEEEEEDDSGKKFVEEWGSLSKKEFEAKQGVDAHKWVYIPSHIRLREPDEWSVVDICRPVPLLAQAMPQFLHDPAAQGQVQGVKFGDHMSFIDLIRITWSSFESVFLYEYRTEQDILPKDKQKLKSFFDPMQDVESIKRLENQFVGKNEAGRMYVLSSIVKVLEAKVVDFGTIARSKQGRNWHPVLQEMESETAVVTKMQQLSAALNKHELWKRWAITKDHTIWDGKGTLDAANKATDKELGEKLLFLRRTTELMNFLIHVQSNWLWWQESERKREELEAKLKLARATGAGGIFPPLPSGHVPTTPAPPPPTAAPAATTHVVVNNNEKREKQAILQAFQNTRSPILPP